MNSESEEEPEATALSEQFCSEEEFSVMLTEQIRLLVHIDCLAVQNQKSRLSRKVYSTLLEQATIVEDLLDDHGARFNETFAGMLELVSSLHAFSSVGQGLKILALQTRAAGFLGSPRQDEAFRREVESTQRFADTCVRSLLSCIHKEAALCCDLSTTKETPLQVLLPDAARLRLPHTLGADDHADVGAMVATEASLFLAAHKTMNERAACQQFDDVDEMRKFVSRVCNEEQARFLEAKLQNIQSRYDTFISNTPIEIDNDVLRDFRHALSMSLQLTKVLGSLVHFYERHEDDLRSEVTKSAVPELIDKSTVLDRILNFSLYFVYQFMEAGVPAAESLLSEFTTSMAVELPLPDGVILHARPASLIAKIVAHHNIPVTMKFGDDGCYAGSIMQIILLAGRHLGETVVGFVGDHLPVKHIEMLFENRLGEDGLDNLPDELDYLRS